MAQGMQKIQQQDPSPQEGLSQRFQAHELHFQPGAEIIPCCGSS